MNNGTYTGPVITTVTPIVGGETAAQELNRTNTYVQQAKQTADAQTAEFNTSITGTPMFKSWKTTLAGFASIIGGVSLILVEGKLVEGGTMIIAGVGLLLAKDADKTGV